MKTKFLILAIVLSCSLYTMANEAETLSDAVIEQLQEMGYNDVSTVTIVNITKNKDGSTTYTLRLNHSDGICIVANLEDT